jgi:hypothetical protein
LDWRAKVELFEQIRREYEFGIGTIVGVASKLGVHRRMVREAIDSALTACLAFPGTSLPFILARLNQPTSAPPVSLHGVKTFLKQFVRLVQSREIFILFGVSQYSRLRLVCLVVRS